MPVDLEPQSIGGLWADRRKVEDVGFIGASPRGPLRPVVLIKTGPAAIHRELVGQALLQARLITRAELLPEVHVEALAQAELVA